MANKNRIGSESACCLSQGKVIKIIGTLSCICGVVIATLTSILTLTTEKNGEDSEIITCSPVNWLLLVGVSQTVTSVWLLVAKDKTKIMKIWVASHATAAVLTVLYLYSLLTSTGSWNYWTRVFFSFIGINFCLMTFMTLIMIEFIIRPIGDHSKTKDRGSDLNL